MPVIDVLVVSEASGPPDSTLAQALADAIGTVLGCDPGRAWVRLETLDRGRYAENGAALAGDELPVFVRVLHARWPAPEALAAQARSLTDAVAAVVRRPPDRVHVEYAPPGAGRVAFGGRLVE